jgi:predicted dehydrogenase
VNILLLGDINAGIKAAQAGKHVLCEKPMGMNAAELEVLLPLAEQVHIAEGFMVRFHPCGRGLQR